MRARSQAKGAAKPEPESIDQWQAFLGDIAMQRNVRLTELGINGGRRRDLAYAAATGREDAIKAAAMLAQRDAAIQHELALLQIAEERAQAEIVRLEQDEAARSRAERIEEQRCRLAARNLLAGSIERGLRELAERLHELDRLSQEVSAAYFALGGERLVVAPLDRGAIGSRLSEFCFGLGLARWLPVACAETKTPPGSFAEIESDAEAAYQIIQ